ncbi:MAG: Mur ligase family protein [Bacteroidota bacterium]
MRIHFISIGGVAMHNLAIALQKNGHEVTGSDDGIFEPSYSSLKQYGLLPTAIGWFTENIHKKLDVVIVGMHAKPDNPELIEAQRKQIRIYSYPEFLYEHSKNKIRVVIAGSHGKTTITAMIVHVLKHSCIDADYMVGGQLQGFEVMVKLTNSASCIIIEGDEYPTSAFDTASKFLHYHPHIAVISGIAWDHVDVFPTFENYLEQFRLFIETIESGGCLIYYQGDKVINQLVENFKSRKIAYSQHPYKIEEGITKIDQDAGKSHSLNIFGLHNMANLSASKLVCKELGITDDVFFQSISSFKGVSRRLELIATLGKSFIYRDFAHAPSKVKATVNALRMQYPDHLLIICLELHCYSSMSENFIDQFNTTLNQADEAIVFYDPKAAVYKNIPVMTYDRIKQGFSRNDLQLYSDNEEMLKYVNTLTKNRFVLAFLTSGRFGVLDFQKFVQNIQSN